MNSSICIIHGGNKKIATDLYNSFRGQILECIINPFPGCKNLTDNIRYLSENTVICDLTTADSLTVDEMLAIRNNARIVKYISKYEDDLQDVEGVWNGRFNEKTHLQSCQRYMIFADDIVDMRTNEYNPKHPPIVFSTGRSGTHVLVNLLEEKHPGIRFTHHDQFSMDELINSQHVYMVVRRNIRDFITSKAILDRYGIMTARPETFDQDVVRAASWEPFSITRKQVQADLISTIRWLNIALYVTRTNPNTTFAFFEDLDVSKVDKFIKNPYDKNKLIANLDEVNGWMEEFSHYDKFIKDAIFKNWGLE